MCMCGIYVCVCVCMMVSVSVSFVLQCLCGLQCDRWCVSMRYPQCEPYIFFWISISLKELNLKAISTLTEFGDIRNTFMTISFYLWACAVKNKNLYIFLHECDNEVSPISWKWIEYIFFLMHLIWTFQVYVSKKKLYQTYSIKYSLCIENNRP